MSLPALLLGGGRFTFEEMIVYYGVAVIVCAGIWIYYRWYA